MRVAVVFNAKSSETDEIFQQVSRRLEGLGAQVIVPPAGSFPGEGLDPSIEQAEVVIALGGDGTIIHIAKRAALHHKPVLGINCGQLGFMAGLEAHELDRLSDLIEGKYTIQPRMMLQVGVKGKTYTALNEAVISRGNLSRMVELSIANHAQPVATYLADGVLVATPTGSTAYSLSAGGPIVDPSVSCLLMTPICSHSLRSRPYIFGDDAVLSVKARSRYEEPAYLTVDGEEGMPLSPEDTVYISRSPISAHMIQIKQQAFYDVLNQKLMDR